MRLSNARKIWLTLLSLVALVVSTFVSGMPAMSMMGEVDMMSGSMPCEMMPTGETHHADQSLKHHTSASASTPSKLHVAYSHSNDDLSLSTQNVDCSDSSDMAHTCCTTACGNTLGLSPIALITNGHSSRFSKRNSEHFLPIFTRIESLERPPTI
ncbi:hypothetical protein [Vibrio nomapromontoriensis]|uniref:hypothetical protein n=1 Tax=Vibrio nomapromontoriensis TaxID=2910246 RepID=UPI003D11869E